MNQDNQMSNSDPFTVMEQPGYPSTCDNCGEVGTNHSMEQHLCSNFEEIAQWPCYIGEHDNCLRRNKDKRCPCICHREAA